MTALAQNIRRRMSRLKLTPSQAATQASIARCTLHTYLNGSREPTQNSLRKLAEVLKTTPAALLSEPRARIKEPT